MRDTLITGLLICLPTAALLASAALALLVNKLRRGLGRTVNRQFRHLDMMQARAGCLPAVTGEREELRGDANALSSVQAGRLTCHSRRLRRPA